MGETAKSDPQSLCFEYEETEGPRGPQLSEVNWWLPGAAGKHGEIRSWFLPGEEQFHLVQFLPLGLRKAGSCRRGSAGPSFMGSFLAL